MNEVNIKVYKDPDIRKMEEICKVMEDNKKLPDEVKRLLVEYHNAISFGLCPNFVRKYKEAYRARFG